MGPANTWDNMQRWLTQLSDTIAPTPKAIIVISAHWESDVVTINNGAHPALLFDYYGFPEHTYQLKYPAPGSPALADKIAAMLSALGISNAMDSERGFDHGVFIPLMLAYPDADIPVVQISLNASLDPVSHLKIGHTLAPLRSEGVLIIGSGMSYHNMKELMSQSDSLLDSDLFDEWLAETCKLPAVERDERLCKWAAAPAARDAHPREEHLLPLMVVAGAAGDDPGIQTFSDRVMGAMMSAYQFS